MAIWQAAKFLAAFALVIFLAAAASRLLASRAQGAALAAFRVLGALGLGGGRSLAAVQVGKRVLVLGLGDKSISLLCTLDSADDLGEPAPTLQVPGFAELLQKAIGKVGRHEASAPRQIGRTARRQASMLVGRMLQVIHRA